MTNKFNPTEDNIKAAKACPFAHFCVETAKDVNIRSWGYYDRFQAGDLVDELEVIDIECGQGYGAYIPRLCVHSAAVGVKCPNGHERVG